MSVDTLQITPLAPALGAEIGGVDLSGDVNDDVIAAIRQALLDHLVVFFRDQDITPEQHLSFARRFGEIVSYPMVTGLEDHPEIVPVVKLPEETHNFGGIWHSDTTYLAEPPLGAILVARELPPRGGDTLFANMVMADNFLAELLSFPEAAYDDQADSLSQLLRWVKDRRRGGIKVLHVRA